MATAAASMVDDDNEPAPENQPNPMRLRMISSVDGLTVAFVIINHWFTIT